MIVDAHLDIAWNALAEGRGFDGAPARNYLVSRRTLAEAGVGLVFPTIFSQPPTRLPGQDAPSVVYRTPGEAELMGQAQLGYYRSIGLHLLRTATELRAYVRTWQPGDLAGVLLMENADAIGRPADVSRWVASGLRIVGPAWMRTRYCGGSNAPGGLTADGRILLEEMAAHQVILDLSHMADRSMRDAFAAWSGPMVTTHAGARALNPGQRQLPDWAIREVGRRGGVVGISFYAGHLSGAGKASARDIAQHALYFARIAGDPQHVGLGSDLDGGFGADHAAIRSMSGMGSIRRALGRHFNPGQVDGIMGQNWIDFLGRSLPN